MTCGVCGKNSNYAEFVNNKIICGSDDCIDAVLSPDSYERKKMLQHAIVLEDALRTASAKISEQTQELNNLLRQNKKLRELVVALHEVTTTYGAFGPTEKKGEWLQNLIDEALK